ncbi:IclR family transcriptional regulator [Salinisphaera sp. T31B1]
MLSVVARYEHQTLTALAATADMACSTAYRMLETLRHHELVAFDTHTQTWSIGVEAFRVGQRYARHTHYLAAGRAVMRRLSEQTGETANMAVIETGELVYVAQIETSAPIRAFIPTGTRGDPQASGIGKVLLAYMDDALRAELTRVPPPAFTDHTYTDAAELALELDRVRARGWAVDDQERYVGMRCIAAPIFNEYAEPIAGLSISAPIDRLPVDHLAHKAVEVVAGAEEVTRRIGGRRPSPTRERP